MKLLVGLGNTGRQYHATRHNLGFAAIDMLAITYGKHPEDFSRHSKAPADVLELRHEYNCILIKPTTMMNLSGEAVQALMHFYKVAIEDVWVIYDDVDLGFGQMRVRLGGGSAGHNGIKSIIQHANDNFWRLRLGIGNEYLAVTPTDKFVLDPFMQTEAELIPTLLNNVANYLESSLMTGSLTDHTQNLLP